MNKLKNNKNQYDNYAFSIIIDADVEEFLKNIEIVTFLETQKEGRIKSLTKKTFINQLIRAEMLNVFKNNDVSSWEEYKEKNNIEQ